MNAMDMRVLGASALTAAIVSVSIGFVMARRDCPTLVAVPTAPAVVAVPAAPPVVAAVEEEEIEEEVVEEAVDTYDDVSLDDCEALKEKGMGHINLGQHTAALNAFEASLQCQDDPYVRQLAFMEACASGNTLKAKIFYKKLTPAQQTKFAQICIRQKPPVAYE
jgi:hypothetical protein